MIVNKNRTIKNMKHLKGMSVFARIVEAGSISQAAEALGVSKSVISQQLKILEDEIGITLLKRTTRKQSLTAAGENFYRYCQRLNNIAEEALFSAKESLNEPQGRVKITASNALMDTIVAPAVAGVVKRHPKIKPEFLSADRHVDIAEERIDLAIRAGSSKDSTMKQQRIGRFRDVFCVHQALYNSGVDNATLYIANNWQSRKIVHRFKSADDDSQLIYEKDADVFSNSYHTCLALLKDQVGVGLIPDFLFNTADELVEVFPKYQLDINHIYAIYPYAQHLPPAVKACLDEIKTVLRNSN